MISAELTNELVNFENGNLINEIYGLIFLFA